VWAFNFCGLAVYTTCCQFGVDCRFVVDQSHSLLYSKLYDKSATKPSELILGVKTKCRTPLLRLAMYNKFYATCCKTCWLLYNLLWNCCGLGVCDKLSNLLYDLLFVLKLVVDFCCALAVGFRVVVDSSYSLLYNKLYDKSTRNRSNGVRHEASSIVFHSQLVASSADASDVIGDVTVVIWATRERMRSASLANCRLHVCTWRNWWRSRVNWAAFLFWIQTQTGRCSLYPLTPTRARSTINADETRNLS